MLRAGEIGTQHLLLGILREEFGLGARVLATFDITLDEARAQVARIDGDGGAEYRGQIAFTPQAKQVLEVALREALSLGHNYIGTEHILLALASQVEGVAAQVLRDFDASEPRIRAETMQLVGGPDVGGSGRALMSAAPIAGHARGGPQQLRIACPRCGAGIETIATDADNTRFEVSAEGDRTCPNCGTHWTISYAVSWLERPAPDET